MSKDDFEYSVVEIDEFEVMATTLLFAFVAPVFALIIEQFISGAWFVEEIIKAFVITRASYLDDKYLKVAVLAGFVFGLSEAMLYVVNASFLWSLEPIGLRLLFTVPMHAITGLVFAYFSRGKGWWMVVGMSLSMAIHGLFNVIVGS
jgi:hypothetical protein